MAAHAIGKFQVAAKRGAGKPPLAPRPPAKRARTAAEAETRVRLVKLISVAKVVGMLATADKKKMRRRETARAAR